MPRSDQGTVVFTTAISDTAKILAPENTMELPQMAAKTAEKILDTRLPNRLENEGAKETLARRESFGDTVTNNNVDVEEERPRKFLLEELSYLPLAITQAAAYIKRNKISISSYLDLKFEQKGKTTNLSNRKSEQQLRHHNADMAVAITTLISLKDVSRQNPMAANCLFFMARVDRKDVLVQLLPTAPSSPVKTTVDLLSTYAILIKRPASSAVELHRLVHLAIRNYLQERALFYQWNQIAIGILAKKFPSASYENRSKWRRLLPHAICALADSSVEQRSDSIYNLYSRIWKCLRVDGRNREAMDCFERCDSWRKTTLDETHPSRLVSQHALAVAYRVNGQVGKAVKLLETVVAIKSTTLDETHSDRLASEGWLAYILRELHLGTRIAQE